MNLLTAMQSTSNPAYKMQSTKQLHPFPDHAGLQPLKFGEKRGFFIVRDNQSLYQRWQNASLKFA